MLLQTLRAHRKNKSAPVGDADAPALTAGLVQDIMQTVLVQDKTLLYQSQTCGLLSEQINQASSLSVQHWAAHVNLHEASTTGAQIHFDHGVLKTQCSKALRLTTVYHGNSGFGNSSSCLQIAANMASQSIPYSSQ